MHCMPFSVAVFKIVGVTVLQHPESSEELVLPSSPALTRWSGTTLNERQSPCCILFYSFADLKLPPLFFPLTLHT